MKAGENDIQDFKEYDDFLAELCTWLKENYDNTLTRKENIAILKERLLKYKANCGINIRTLFNKSGLKKKGYRLQNWTSKKHPLRLGKYLILKKQECIAQGTYEQMVDWITTNKDKTKRGKKMIRPE